MADDGSKRAALVLTLTDNFDKLLSTILIGNNIVNIASTSIATVLFISLIKNQSTGSTVSTVVMTVAVLIFGEVSPKSLAKESPEKFAMFSAPFLRFLMAVFTPFVAFFVLLKKLLKVIFRFEAADGITGDELLNIVDEAESGGGIDEGESDLIRSAISFGDCTAADILTPRVDVVAIDENEDIPNIREIFDESGFSRLPVYSENIDNIKGIIHIRDFDRRVFFGGEPLTNIIKSPVYVAKQIPVDDLLRLMQEKKTHIAVINDEYGGTVGIVTMEDILEELVGEIWDEHDEIINDFTVNDDASVTVNCSIQLDKFFEYFEISPEEEFTSATVGGWVLELLGKIADIGDTCTYKNLSIEVTKTDQLKTVEVKVTKAEVENDDPIDTESDKIDAGND